MKFHRLLSTILHPIVLPTLAVFFYFMLETQSLEKRLKYVIIGLVVVLTYVIPLLLLIYLKKTKHIQSFEVTTIRERRFPILFMIALFYFLGNIIIQIPTMRSLGILFYGTSLSLIFIYILFSFKLKSSLHLVSMGNMIGFFIILGNINGIYLLPIIAIMILLSGILASSRLYLKAHIPIELLVGFFLGVFSQFLLFYML
tara:strand:- start:30327 stop:30926 length:600 start_codon:yes stop_codon:yes gene_type:complete